MGKSKYRIAICLVASCIALGALPPAYAADDQAEAPSDAELRIQALAARQLEELGIPDRFLPFLEEDGPKVRTGRDLYGEPTADMTGGPSPELFEVDLRYSYTINEGEQQLPSVDSEVDTRITVRNGADGRKFWTKRYNKDAWPISMRVGKSGRQGVVVMTGIWGFFGTTEERTIGLHAFTGSGKPLWTREYRSVSYQDLLVSVTEDAPLIIATLDGLAGRAEDLMVALATSASTMLSETMTVRVVMIDGGTGSEVVHPFVDVGVNWWPIPLPTNDLDGDGLDDYATTNNFGVDLGEGQEAPSFGGTVYTRKGTDGSAIWTTSGIEMVFFAFPTKLPQVVGNQTPDLGLQTYVERTVPLLPVPLPLPLPLATGFRYISRVYLFDGDRGLMRWHKPSEWLYSPGDIDRDGNADLMLGNFRASFEKGRTVLEQLALRGDGDRLWKRRSVWRFETMPCPEDMCFRGWGYHFDPSPDFQPDRVTDLLFGQEVSQNAAFEDKVTRAYNGRTGNIMFEDGGSLQVVGAAVDGRGTDLLAFKHDGNHVGVAVRNGSNRTLWDGRLVSAEKILPRKSWFYGSGFRLPGDRCAEVVLAGWEEGESFYAVLDGADASMLWSRWTAPKAQRLDWRPRNDLNVAC